MVFMRPRLAFILNLVFQLIDRLNDCIHVVFVQSGNTFFVKLDPVPRVNSCPRGFCCCVKLDSSYQLSKIAEILWVNQQGEIR